MVRNQRVTGTAMPMPLGLVLGTGVALAILLVSAIFIAWLALGEKMPLHVVGYAVMAVHLLSVFVGCSTACAAIKHRKMVVCLLVGCTYFLCMIGCTAMFFGGQYQGMGVTALVVAIAAALTGWLSSKGDNAGKKRYKKYRNR